MSTVEVYTRPRCLFCHQVLDLLNQAKLPFRQIDIADRAEQDRLAARYQAVSFPLVVVDGVYVGGYAHVLHLHAQNRLATLGPTADALTSTTPERASSSSLPVETPRPQPAPSHFGSMSRLHQLLKEDPSKKR